MANTTAINSELLSTMVARASFAAYENSIARAVATVYDLPYGEGKTVTLPVYAGMTAQVIGNEADTSFADTNTTSASVTLAEVSVGHRVKDLLRDSAQSVIGDLAFQMGRAVGEGLDSQLTALFSNVGITQVVGSAGAANTVADLFKAAAILRTNKLTGPFFAVVHPKQAYDLKKELALNGGSNIPALSQVGEGALRSAVIGSVAGITVIESALVGIDVNDDATGCVFSPAAFAHVARGGMNLQTQYQAAARATDIVLTQQAGAGIINAAWAVQLIGDTATW